MICTVIIHLEGAREFATRIDNADNSRDAIDRAWTKWAAETAHPTRVLVEHKRDLTIHVIADR